MMSLRAVSELAQRMLRWRTGLLLLLFVAIADAATKTSHLFYSPRLLLVVAILGPWYIFSTSVNDLADEEIDKINLKGNRDRPLANQRASRRELWLMAAASLLLSLTLSLVLGGPAVWASLGALLLSFCYSMPPVRISYRGILAPLLLPLAYVAYPFYLTTLANRTGFTAPRLQLLLALYICFIGRIILKDFRDVKGDRKFGKRTFIVRHGARLTCLTSAAAWLIGYVVIIWRFWHWPFLPLTTLPFIIGIFYFLQRLSLESKIPKQVQLVGLVGRLANGTALLILAALYHEITPNSEITYVILLLGLALLNLNVAYVLYAPLLRQNASTR